MARKPKTPPKLAYATAMIGGRETHWYVVDGATASGRGTTTLLGRGLPKPFLKQWAANTAAQVALDEQDVWMPLAQSNRAGAYDHLRYAHKRDMETAGAKGTDVHKLAERLMAGEEFEVDEHLVDYVDRFIEWHQEWKPEIVATEVIGANFTRNYYGRFDFLAKVKGWWPPPREQEEALVLWDIKTSRSGPYESDAVQLAAYANFEQVCFEPDESAAWKERNATMLPCTDLVDMPAVDGMAVLHLRPEAATVHKVAEERHRALFALFLHVCKVAEFCPNEYKREDAGWSGDVFSDDHTHHEPF